MNILFYAFLQLQIAALKLQLAVQNPTDVTAVQDAQASATAAIQGAQQALVDFQASQNTTSTLATAPASSPPAASSTFPLAAAPQINQTTTPMPQVQKTITIEQGPYPVIYAFYSEDGVNLPNVQLTLAADDNGKVTSSGSPDKYKLANNSQLTHPNVGIDGKIGAMFEYQPNATGTRTLTITGNGVTQTLQVPGLQE